MLDFTQDNVCFFLFDMLRLVTHTKFINVNVHSIYLGRYHEFKNSREGLLEKDGREDKKRTETTLYQTPRGQSTGIIPSVNSSPILRDSQEV